MSKPLKGIVTPALAFVCAYALPAVAEAPDLQTPAPVIALADNLDENDGLGWCIDTLGRGFSTDLQTHSCKPQGGDVQFSFESETGAIRSVAFPEYCVTLRPDGEPTDFGLKTCDDASIHQQFAYDIEAGSLTPVSAPDLCMAAGAVSRSAGPFMSRDLVLASCNATDPDLRRWIVKN